MIRRVKRHRVAVRPKVRSQRARKAAAVACLLLLGGAALAVVSHLRSQKISLAEVRRSFTPAPRSLLVEGAPEPLRRELDAMLTDGTDTRDDRSAELLEEFPCLASAERTRGWFSGRHVYRVRLKAAVAPATRAGRPAGWLGEDGSVFDAPEGVYSAPGPRVDVGAASSEELAKAARFLRSAASSQSLLSPISLVRHVSARDGWEVSFEDGTTASWGDLRWTDEKLARLREVLLDARGQFPGALTADLRYFEDGRVLLRPGMRR